MSCFKVNYFSKNNPEGSTGYSTRHGYVWKNRKLVSISLLFFILVFHLALRHVHITSGKSGSVIVQMKDVEGLTGLVSTF